MSRRRRAAAPVSRRHHYGAAARRRVTRVPSPDADVDFSEPGPPAGADTLTGSGDAEAQFRVAPPRAAPCSPPRRRPPGRQPSPLAAAPAAGRHAGVPWG